MEILLFPVEQLPVLRTYSEFDDVPEDHSISLYSMNEIATEKVVALPDRARNEPRAVTPPAANSALSGVERELMS